MIRGFQWSMDPDHVGRNEIWLKKTPKKQAGPEPPEYVLSFSDYIREVNPRYQFYRHTGVLIEQLERVEAGDLTRLMIFMPPRHGKSELSSRLFPGWYLRRRPQNFVALSSYGADLSYGFSRNARDYYERSGGELDKSAGAIKHWETGHGGGMWACGVGGPATGRGFSVGIVDDPVKSWEEAYSETIRERNWNWWQSTWLTRMNETTSALIIILTRWHEDDLAGRILQQERDEEEDPERWTIVNMEAIKDKVQVSFPASCKVIRDTRKEGQALNPDRFPVKYLRKKERAVGQKVWASLYQQNPTPFEGALWKSAWFDEEHLFDDIPPGLLFVGNDWDTAYGKDEENSASAMAKMGILRNGDIYLLELGARWLEMPELLKWMRRIRDPHYIEAKASGKSARQMLAREGIEASEVQVEGGADKVARTNLVTPTAESGHFYVRRSLVQYLLHDEKQGILRFPAGKNDDVNDVIVQGIGRLRRRLKDLQDAEEQNIRSVSSTGYRY